MKRSFNLLFVLLLCAELLSAQSVVYPWQDTSLSMEQRVEKLISGMTVEEKIEQMMNDAPAIDRLGVPAYNWWNECLHGVARAGIATVYPFGFGLSYSTFSYSNLRLPGEVRAGEPVEVAIDVRNTGQRDGEEVVNKEQLCNLRVRFRSL